MPVVIPSKSIMWLLHKIILKIYLNGESSWIQDGKDVFAGEDIAQIH